MMGNITPRLGHTLLGWWRKMRVGAAVATVALIAVPAIAQDEAMPTIDYNGALNDARVTGRMVRQAQQRRRTAVSHATSKQRAICANKARYRAKYGARNPDVIKLYGLCRNDGL